MLLAIVAVLAIWSLILCYMYFGRARQIRDMQMYMTQINSRQQAFGMLVNDAAEYAKQHPAMDQLLRSIGVAKAAQPAATNMTRQPGK